MKKYFSIALIAVVGLFAWSCSDDNVVAVYNPDSVTPQTLGDVTGVTLAPDGDPITIPFSAVDFGLDVPASYTLYVAKAGTNFDPQQKVPATILSRCQRFDFHRCQRPDGQERRRRRHRNALRRQGRHVPRL